MQQTLMNLHICSMDKVEQSLMLDVFSAYKLRNGFVPCDKEEAEQTYFLAYEKSEKCSWLSLTADYWHDDLFAADSSPYGLSLDYYMGTVLLKIADDGSALFELNDDFVKKAAIRPIGENVPERFSSPFSDKNLNTEFWTKFTNTFATEQKFENVLSGSYHSAEETAEAIADLLHIDYKKLLMDALHNTENATATMYFKTAQKAEKKLTVRAVFKKIYGEALKPLGFVYAKTKEPCFIRVVNDELIHIIGMHDMRNFIVPFAGVATLYRADLGLDQTYRNMTHWLPNAREFWIKSCTDTAADPRFHSKFQYSSEYPESLRHNMQASLKAVQHWVLPKLDEVKSLDDFLAYHEKMSAKLGFPALPLFAEGVGDGGIQYLLPNIEERLDNYCKERSDAVNKKFTNGEKHPLGEEAEQYLYERSLKEIKEKRSSVQAFLDDLKVRQDTLEELERRKQANLEKLHSYGVI